MKQILIAYLIFLYPSLSYTQIGAPSLTAGAGKLLYEKGSLNSEIILSSIASKRDEVRIAFVERFVSQQLDDINTSYTFQRFVNNNLHALFNEKNPEIIKKEIIKNAAELLFTVSSVEFFLQAHIKKTDSDKRYHLDPEHLNKIHLYLDTISNRYPFKLGQPRFVLKQLNSIDVGNGIALGDLIVDVVLYEFLTDEALSNELNKLGLFSSHQDLQTFRESKLKVPADLTGAIEELMLDFKNHFTNALKWKSLIRYNHLDNFPDAGISNSVFSAIDLEPLKDNLINLVSEWNQEHSTITNNDKKFLENVVHKLLGVKKNWYIDQVDELFYFLNDELLTKFFDLSTRIDNPKLKIVYKEIIRVRDNINEQFNELLNGPKSALGRYNEIIDILVNLDKIESYAKLFSKLDDIYEMLEKDIYYKKEKERKEKGKDPKVAKAEAKQMIMAKTIVRLLTSVYDKYTTFNKESNTMSIDVSSMSFDIYTKLAEGNGSRLSVYYTVGANYLLNNTNSSLSGFNSSVGFVSEKIGLKFKVVDFERKSSYGLYRKLDERKLRNLYDDPVVSDVHAIAFGSGLLYRIDALNTENDFEGILGGAGVGVTFFNGLDFNFNVAHVFGIPKKNVNYFNFSFDIAFGEYLSALSENRKTKQIQKFQGSHHTFSTAD